MLGHLATFALKKIILSITLAALTMGGAAQNTDSTHVNNDTVKVTSGNPSNPEFKGGQKALKKFLSKNLEYPEVAANYSVEGSVIMTFVVGEDGSLSDISAHDCKIECFNTTKFSQETESRQKELKKQFALLFAKEGARVIRKMPKWTPGTLNGKAVRIKFDLRISFIDPNK